MTRPFAGILIDISSRECEECGSHLSGAATVSFDDGRSFTVPCDGHFGSSWDGEGASLAHIATRLAGFLILINGEPDDEFPCFDPMGADDISPLPAELPPESETTVKVDLFTEEDEDGHLAPSLARWTTPSGVAFEHRFSCGGFSPFRIALFLSLVQVSSDRPDILPSS